MNGRPVLLVTGGARRVGRHLVLHFARLGFDTAVTYRTSADDASTLADAVQAHGVQCLTIRADLTDPAAASPKIAHAVAARFGRLDLLVHNASLYEPTPADPDALATHARRMSAVHVESPILLTDALAPLLKQAPAPGGSVVAVTDAQLDRPRPAYAAYTATKAGLAALVPVWARRLAPGVTVNAVAPGVVLWPPGTPQAEKDAYVSRVPAARVGTPGDVAAAVEFLHGDGKYLNGQTLRLDGGRSVAAGGRGGDGGDGSDGVGS